MILPLLDPTLKNQEPEMSDSTAIPDAVLWHEGMLLMPQHFQAADQHHEAQLHYKLMSLNPFSWGVNSFEINQGLLLQGLFRVLSLSAVMPDGQIVCFKNDDVRHMELEISLDVTDAAQPEGVCIWITIPKHADGTLVDGKTARYQSRETIVRDQTTGEEIQVPGLVPNIALWVGEIPPSRFSALPLAHVKAKGVQFSLTHFVPPLMVVRDDTKLYSLCHTLAERIRSKASTLVDRAASLSANESSLLLETRFHMLGLLTGLSAFEALLHSKAAHPLTLFTAMHSLAGGAASIGGTFLPPRVDYEHTDPMRCFKKIAAFICRMIEAGIPESYKTHVFKQEKSVFTLELKNIPYGEGNYVIGVSFGPSDDPQKIQEWMDRAVIGKDKTLNKLMKQRTIGAQRNILDRIPGMVTPVKVILYKVHIDETTPPPNELFIAGVAEGQNMLRPSSICLFTFNTGDNDTSTADDFAENSNFVPESNVQAGVK